MSNPKETSDQTTPDSNISHAEIVFPAVWRRFAAIIYDTLLLLALSMGYGGIALVIAHLTQNNQDEIVSGPLFQLGWLVVLLGFFCYFWMRAGQTLGMRAWRLQVIRVGTEHAPIMPSLAQCLGRCLLAPVGLILFIVGMIRKDRQCLHDLATHTRLVLLEKAKKK